jgi:hypothetical protein
MRPAFKWFAFLAGLALVAWIAASVDLGVVARTVARIGFGGMGIVCGLFALGVLADVGAWRFMFAAEARAQLSLARLWLVQMVGEALSVLMPFGSLSGEPFKALLLKKRYDIGYPQATASLMLIQTVNTLTEVPFVLVGMALAVASSSLPPLAKSLMIFASLWLTGFIALVLGALHLRLLVVLQRRLERSRFGTRFAALLAALGEVEQHLFDFVRKSPVQFFGSLGLAFANWFCGAVEMYVVLRFLGQQVSFWDGWLIESTVVLARNVSFFVPAHMGAQESVITVVTEAIVGSAEVGLAVAVIRRARELIWSAVGLAIGGWFGLKPTAALGSPP